MQHFKGVFSSIHALSAPTNPPDDDQNGYILRGYPGTHPTVTKTGIYSASTLVPIRVCKRAAWCVSGVKTMGAHGYLPEYANTQHFEGVFKKGR